VSLSPAERLLLARGVALAEEDLEARDPTLVGDPDRLGVLVVAPEGPGLRVWAVLRLGVAAEDRERFAGWVVALLDRFLEHGPGPDGWQARATQPGSWQLWSRSVVLPDMGFLGEPSD
jgi:hypothetical protein